MAVIVFSPHEDDETLACGGTIIKKRRQGNEIYIVFLTDGRNSHKTVLNIEENPTPEEVKMLRGKEAKEAAKILGVQTENIFFLDFEDGTLKDNTFEACTLIEKFLTQLKPTEIFIPHREDIHKDHSSTNAIVLSAVKKLHLDLDVYEYMIWFKKDEKFKDILKCPHLIEINISDVVHLKTKAIDMYQSQVNILFPSQTKPILDGHFLSSFRKPVEHFIKYRVFKP